MNKADLNNTANQKSMPLIAKNGLIEQQFTHSEYEQN